jgi:hypothetical protein
MTVHGVASSAVGVIIATTILVVAASIAIVLRFLARRRSAGTGIDDWAALSAYFFLLAVSVCHYLIVSPYGSAGHPQSDLNTQQLKQYLIILYADNICYTCCTITVKLSIILLLRRIFTPRLFQIIAYILTGIFVVWWITVLFFQIFSCSPVHSFWDFELQQSCIDTTKFYNGVAISNILMDFILLTLPLPMIWKLQMTLRKKLQVSFIFILGGFTLICSILRTMSLRALDVNNQTGTFTCYCPLFPPPWTYAYSSPCRDYCTRWYLDNHRMWHWSDMFMFTANCEAVPSALRKDALNSAIAETKRRHQPLGRWCGRHTAAWFAI